MITARFEKLPEIESNHIQATCSVTHAAKWQSDGKALGAAENQLQREVADRICKQFKPVMDPHPYGVVYKMDDFVFTPSELHDILEAVYDSGVRGEGMSRSAMR